MTQLNPEAVRELLRQVPCPGRSRDIVALGFVRGVATETTNCRVEFAPDTVNADKVRAMEDGIRSVLREAGFTNIELETEPPYDDDSMLLGGESTNPLQIDLGEYGLEPTPDIIEGEGQRARNLLTPEPPKDGHPAEAAQFGEEPSAMSPEGPLGNTDPDYTGDLPVFQWQVDPAGGDPDVQKMKVSIGNWNFVVGCLRHATEGLVYASIQARHWIYHDGKARPNPAGRTEAVNLVYDEDRCGIVAIYGTVRDFRPFVEAFDRCYLSAAAEAPPAVESVAESEGRAAAT